eukprot:Lithocolla_globosa_v1_NODE_1565_length_2482_cov_16.247631.p1 type:complete len:765 gc:universal NODE_1565_length_2482_cov_16.247631:2415-121(-)
MMELSDCGNLVTDWVVGQRHGPCEDCGHPKNKHPRTSSTGNAPETPVSKRAKIVHSSDVVQPSPEKPQGPEIDLQVPALLQWLRTRMKQQKFVSRPHILQENSRNISLQGRKDAVNTAVNALVKLSAGHGTSDRTELRIPVCSGMSGLGKTRLLEEGPNLLQLAHIPGRSYFVIITYGNGQRLRSVEHSMSAVASFCWRLLYTFFLADNCEHSFAEFFMYELPKNAADITLRVALQVISTACWKADESINLFVGVDEYQVIQNIKFPAATKKGLILDLVNEFIEVIMNPINHLILLPMLAGTDFDVLSVAGSSTGETVRLPMSLLTMPQCIAAVESMPDTSRFITSPPFKRHLFYLGGVPRWVAEYTRKVASSPGRLDAKTFEDAFRAQITQHVSNLASVKSGIGWGDGEFIQLAAYAFSGVEVQEGQKNIGGLPWSRIRDSSLCLLDNGLVIVPYAIIRRIGNYLVPDAMPLATRCFVWTVRSLIEHVDDRIYDLEPWQLWEKFGAHFHAARINALQVLGETVVAFSDLCKGAVKNGCEDKVILRPVEVFETESAYGVDIQRKIPQFKNSAHTIDWVTGDTLTGESHGYVVINGANGKGVDVFFALRSAFDATRYFVCADQRKRVAGCLGEDTALKLIEKARISPGDQVEVNLTVIVGLFSVFPHFSSKSGDALPSKSFVVAYEQSERYHGSLQFHPASSPCINVNDDSSSTIQMVLRGGKRADAAALIIEKRKTTRFQNVSELETVANDFGVTVKERDRIRF